MGIMGAPGAPGFTGTKGEEKKEENKIEYLASCVCVCVEATRVEGPSVASNVQTGLRTLLEHTALVVLPC